MVVFVEGAAAAQRGGFVQRELDLMNEPGVVALGGQPGGEQVGFNVAVVGVVGPVAEVGVAQGIAEETDNPLLGVFFAGTDGVMAQAPSDPRLRS